MLHKKKICFFSTNRADFNYIFSIFAFFQNKNYFDNFLTFNKAYSNVNFINENISNKKNLIPYNFNFIGNSELNLVREISDFSKIVGKLFSKFKFNYIFLIGDRYEAHLIASIANIYNLPVVHVHGGEITEGSYDDKFRHSITKLSSIHFVANNIYKKRVVQMGENKKNVHNTGSPSIDFLKNFNFFDKNYLSIFFKISFDKPSILICYNSVTNKKKSDKHFKNLLIVLSKFSSEFNIFFSLANNDISCHQINKDIKSFVKKFNKKNIIYFKNVGSKVYLSLLKEVDIIVGNSSSGIIEAPFLGTRTLNIGDRQKGRLMEKSITNITGSIKSINEYFDKNLKKNFRFKKLNYYYGTGNSIKKMHKYMLNYSNTDDMHKKKFKDIKFI